MKNKEYLLSLAESGILIALSIALSFIKIIQMPLGGSVTLASMLPICIIGIRHGMKWGFISSFIYGLFQLLFGFVVDGILAWGLSPFALLGCIILDYILAYLSLGFSCIFRKKGIKGILLGILIAFSLRLFFHVISGVLIFSNLDQWNAFGTTFVNRPLLYSICYNGFYILPELLITYLVVIIMFRFPYIKNNLVK